MERDGTSVGRLEPSVRWALASLSLSMLMPSLDTSIANAGLPSMAQAFNASFQEAQWIVLAYLIAITALIVSVGRLGDIIGRRRLLLVGISLFTVASLACGVAPTVWMLIAARATQGLGAAIMMALAVALVGETVPKSKTGSAMGLLGTMSAIGTTLGPSLGGVLIAGFGWQMIFLVNVPIGILNFILAHRALPADRREPRNESASFDYVGTLLLAGTLAAYALAMTIGRGHFGSLNTVLLLVAISGAGIFFLVQGRIASPLIRLAIFRDPVVGSSLAMSTLVSTVMMTTLVVGPFYLSRGLGLRTSLVGLTLSIGPLVAALMGVPAGRLVDRLGGQRMTVIGLIGIMVGSTALALIPAGFCVASYVAPISIITASFALFQAANNTVIMTGISADQRGVIAGMLSLSRNLGLLTGVSVMGAVFAFASGAENITTARPEAIANGMRIAFAVAALLVVAALIVALGSRVLAKRRSLQFVNGRMLAIGLSLIGLFAWDDRVRAQAFPTPSDPYDLRATQLESGFFDEGINGGERLQGLNASLIVSPDSSIYIDPFWIHSESSNFRSANQIGLDDRDTYGVRLWGKRGELSFDWTIARQTGESVGRDVEAWGLFAVQSLALSDNGWKPRLTTHIDIASGGGYGGGTVKSFNQLYASSNYLGEGRFLSHSNLFQIAPGISVSPTPATNISIEYGFARRFTEDDAVYAGGMRAYPGTQNVPGHEIGGLLRITGTWTVTENLTLSCDYEHHSAGDVLKRAQLPSSSYCFVAATFRF